MNNTWEKDNCANMKALYSAYSIQQAAALWCGIPEQEVKEILQSAKQISSTGTGKSIWLHPDVPCLEPRCRAISEAMEDGILLYGREDGKPITNEHIAHERRRILGRNLKQWILDTLPNDKPPFLFDEIEQNTHSAISVDAYRSLKAERDTLSSRLDNAKKEYLKLKDENTKLTKKNASLQTSIGTIGASSDRAEVTYQNIIAALLDYISGNIPGSEKHQCFTSESKLIELIDDKYDGYPGLSKSNLSRKFPEAKKALISR